MEERVQKILAQAGYGSRRSCETLITAGRVKINGKIAILGSKADAYKDTIQVDGQTVAKPAREHIYIALHKPRGVLSDHDAKDPRPSVWDLVTVQGHLFVVGRLDFDSEGLMVMTNDGDLANHLTHPRYEHEKEYRVLLQSKPDEQQLAAWRHGVVLEEGYRTAPAKVRVESQSTKGIWMRVIMKEGRKRQIRETCKQIGLFVERIVRVRIGGLELDTLKAGEWRYLSPAEVKLLKVPSLAPKYND